MMKFLRISIVLFFIAFFNSSSLAAIATSDVKFSGTLIQPASCTVNNGQEMTVNYGTNVLTTSVDGTNNARAIPFTVSCSDLVATGVKYQIVGTIAGFNGNNTLQTDKADLGITIKSGTTAIPLNTNQSIIYPTVPSLTGTLSKRAANTILTAGAFTATAQIRLEYD